MAKKHLSTDKQQLPCSGENGKLYYVETMGGINIYLTCHIDKLHCDHAFGIPWRMLRTSLKRKDKK